MERENTVRAVAALGDKVRNQVAFALTVHTLTDVERLTCTAAGRCETSAEHSWHVALLGYSFAEYAIEPIDVTRAVMLLLVHDVPEIDAGDVSVYDTAGRDAAQTLEAAGAKRIFGLLGSTAGNALEELWAEFEAAETAEARYAKAVDRIAPLLLSHANGGVIWQANNMTAVRLMDVHGPVLRAGGPMFETMLRVLLDDAVAQGWIREQ